MMLWRLIVAAACAAGACCTTTTTTQQADLPDDVKTLARGSSMDVLPQRRFDGHVVLRVAPQTQHQLDQLRDLFHNDEIDVWRSPSQLGEDVQFRVPLGELNSTASFLDQYGMKYETAIPDVQRLIDSQQVAERMIPVTFGWNRFHRLETIYEWMSTLPNRFPDVATLVDGGGSTEGRRILGVRIAHSPDLPVVFLEGGIHGREWASPAATTFILNQLLEGTEDAKDPAVARMARMARSYEWHVFPSVNPDAYEYTHTTDRLWRKSRRRTSIQCYGADLNRNFPFQWGTVGVSWNLCSTLFPGTRAASEVETRTRIAYLEDLLPRMKAFIALHSFGQYLLLPWGHTRARPEHYDRQLEVAKKAAAAFARRHGTQLRVGGIAELLYPASGSSSDWAHSHGVPHSATFELRDRGTYGFLLPKSEIIPASEEAFDGVLGMVGAIHDLPA